MPEQESHQNLPEKYFPIENIHHIYSLAPMVAHFREEILQDPNHWYSLTHRAMVKDLSEDERNSSFAMRKDAPVEIPRRPWNEIPASIQDVLKTVYDAASHDKDEDKSVSIFVQDNFIRFELHSPSIHGGMWRKDMIGETIVSDVDLTLTDKSGLPGPNGQNIQAGFWAFMKEPAAKKAKIDAIRRSVDEEERHMSLKERLYVAEPTNFTVYAALPELEDLGEYLDKVAPYAQVITHKQDGPTIAEPAYLQCATHELSVDERGRLRFVEKGKEMSEGISPTELEIGKLQDMIVGAFDEILQDPQEEKLWQKFWFTYQARNKVQGLPEFGYTGEYRKPARGKRAEAVGDPEKGLVNALIEVVRSYEQDYPEDPHNTVDESTLTKNVSEYKKQIKNALFLFGQDTPENTKVEDLAWLLGDEGISVDRLTQQSVKEGLKMALKSYWNARYSHGYYPD